MENTPSLGPAPTPAAGTPVDGPQRRVLEAVATTPGPQGPTVGELADVLGGHENTVRHHLGALGAAGLVEARTDPARNRRGRPAVRYRATAQGHAVLAAGQPMVEEYVALAGAFSQRLAERGDPADEDARAIGRVWGSSLHATAGSPPATQPVPLVLTTLTRLGFSPSLDPAAPAPHARVLLHTCPLLDAARTYPGVVCQVHRGLVEGLLDAAGAVGAEDGEDGEDGARTVLLEPFAEPGACILRLRLPRAAAPPRATTTSPH